MPRWMYIKTNKDGEKNIKQIEHEGKCTLDSGIKIFPYDYYEVFLLSSV